MAESVTFRVRVQPRASKNEVSGMQAARGKIIRIEGLSQEGWQARIAGR